jgi:hypothetical protein
MDDRVCENARPEDVNIVRRPELVAELKTIGGDLVVVDSPDVSKEIKAAVGQAELRLALDGVSGPAAGCSQRRCRPTVRSSSMRR